MRIRQRKVRLPLSSLSPIPLTDPLFTSSPVVQLHPTNDDEEDNPCVRNNPSPTLLLSDNKTGQQQQQQQPDRDPNPPIGTGGAGAARTRRENRQVVWREGEGKGGDDGEGNDDDDDDTSSRKGSSLGAEMPAAMILHQLSSSHQGVGRWRDEEEKAFPLKNRISGGFERGVTSEAAVTVEEDSKKFVQQNGDEDHEEKDETKEGVINGNNSNTRKRGRGGALMEGSRCSRVNGRGWRCGQQTLVGYSLCEHHLGKGRLRSMNNVRNRSKTSSAAASKKDKSQTLPSPLSASPSQEEEMEPKMLLDVKIAHGACKDEDEKMPSTAGKKKMKLGMVKARSISSLLGPASYNGTAMADDNE